MYVLLVKGTVDYQVPNLREINHSKEDSGSGKSQILIVA
jgi:hypothetical protein